jgi:hypothetical protein
MMRENNLPCTLALILLSGSGCGSDDSAGGDAQNGGEAASGAQSAENDVAGVPCDVAGVVSENCTRCHASTPKYGAPMPLMTHADFIAPAKTDPSRKVFEVIPARINADDVTRRMPPASFSPLAAPDLATLNQWLTKGASASKPSCAITIGDSAPATGSDAVATSSGGGATSEPRQYDDPDLKCYEFRAHAAADKTQPFSVSTQPDQYTNFTFMPPWQGAAYARSFRGLEGNAAVIHHWLFYKNSSAGPDGDVSPSIGAHPNGELVHGWAPGGSDVYLDPDVGLEVPGNVSYTLETHHNNTSGGPLDDTSGIELCVTPKAPTNVAGLAWLGTDSINGVSASGTCKPTSGQRIQIISFQPHMHLKGRHMTAEITRADGTKEMLHDEPFDFQYQRSYTKPTTLMPGDSIKTTCEYKEPARFGEGTNDEMCYLFTLHYPKLSLTNGNLIAGLIHGPNTCLQ